MTNAKLRIAVLFGGRSAEHDVSVLSATNVMRALDPARYDAVPIFITREGAWLLSSLRDGTLSKPESGTEVCLVPGGRGRMIAIPAGGAAYDLPKIDILFPVLHGLHGEDGSVQGLAEVARVPLAGCGILGSAAALDKDIAKRLLKEAGWPIARSVTIHDGSPPSFADLEGELGLPLFIKPARQGSSVGVSKVSDGRRIRGGARGRLQARQQAAGGGVHSWPRDRMQRAGGPGRRALRLAPGRDRARGEPRLLQLRRQIHRREWRGTEGAGRTAAEVESRHARHGRKAFRAVGCDGMARVDFFLMPDMQILVNEINTIPGFTDISMYSKAMAASGVGYAEIIDRLVEHGLARAAR